MSITEKTAEIDVEARSSNNCSQEHVAGQRLGAPVYADETGAVASHSFTSGNTLYAKVQGVAGKLGVEQRGIERVPEDERTDTSLLKVATMWCSANMALSSFSVGVLSQTLFYIGFVDSFLTILFINILGCLPVAFFSTFGPKFGLRQMVLSRFHFGYYTAKIFAFLNMLACIFWSAINSMVGAQLINTVNPNVPSYAGIVILAVCTFIIVCFGYKIVHKYEGYAWIPVFIIFMIALGQFAVTGDFNNLPMAVGDSAIGSVLSFASSVFGFAAAWTAAAADYTVYQPVGSSRLRVFLWTFGGLMFPLCFTQWLGLAVATAYQHPPADIDSATFVGNIYTQGYNTSYIGGLLGAVLVPAFGRFGQFCLIVLSLSVVANNCPNIYSLALCLQVLWRPTQHVPRFIWSFVGTVIYVAIAIPAYGEFEDVLQNFMLVLAYWLAIYLAVSLLDHIIFKKGFQGYVVAIYNRPGKLPPGLAAFGAFCFGALGAVLGMAQVWFIGPIGVQIGNPMFGGDIGFELSFLFSGITYVALRTLELKFFKR